MHKREELLQRLAGLDAIAVAGGNGARCDPLARVRGHQAAAEAAWLRRALLTLREVYGADESRGIAPLT